MFEVNNKYTRTNIFIVNFDHISYLFLMFLLLTLNKQMLIGNKSKKLNLEEDISDLYHFMQRHAIPADLPSSASPT